MSLEQSVEEYVRAGFVGIWIKTYEQDEAVHELRQLCQQFKPGNVEGQESNGVWIVATWDAQNLLQGPESIMKTEAVQIQTKGFTQPSLVFAKLPEIVEQSKNSLLLMVFKNWHRKEFSDNTQLIQCIQNLVAVGKGLEDFKFHLVFLAPTDKVPLDLEKHLVVVNHDLPSKEMLWDMAKELADDNNATLPDDPEEQMLIKESAAGLTRYEAEGAFSLSIIRTRSELIRIDPSIVWDIKAQTLRKRGLLEIYEGNASFDQMGGLNYFREFSNTLLSKRVTNPLLYPKGLLLLGVPGSGKTQAVRCLGRETGRRVLHMRMGGLRSKFQGESDANMEAALEVADAMAPCILFID